MAFRRGKSKGTSTGLTGLFKTKRRGLYVGSVQDFGELITKIKKARADSKELVFFLWKQDEPEEGQPVFRLSVDVSRDEEERPRSKNKPIDPDPDDDDPEPKKDEDPF